jgi:hypothetical protein
MLAYCIAFGVRRGTIVYARQGLDRPRMHEIKRHGYEIDVRALGIEQEPVVVLEQVAQIAADIAATAPDYIAGAAC